MIQRQTRLTFLILLCSLGFLILTKSIYAADDRTLLIDAFSDNIRKGDLISYKISEDILSLDKCFSIAINNSPDIGLAKEEYKLSCMRYTNASKDIFPELSVGFEEMEGSTTGEDFRAKGTKLELQYELFPYTSKFKKLKQAALNKEVAVLKHNQILLEKLSIAESAYYVFAETYNRLIRIKEMMKVFDKARTVIKEREGRKLSRDVDVLESMILIKEADAKLKAAKKDLILAELSLKQLFEDYADRQIKVDVSSEYNLINTDLKRLTAIAIDNRTDIKIHALLEYINKYNLEIAANENNIKVVFDGFYGEKAEAFVSESLDYDDEYYMGVKVSFPFGGNTIESQYVNQDTVPAAGQTTSSEFTSKNIKLKLFDNILNEQETENQIKYYKSVEDVEKIKKAAIFEVGKVYFEMRKKYELLDIAKEKLKLSKKKLEFKDFNLSAGKTTIADYLTQAMSVLTEEENYSKALSAYYISTAELNKVIAQPAYLNPFTGKADEKMFNFFIQTNPEKSFLKGVWNFLSFSSDDDNYYPQNSFKGYRFKKQ